ncbi:MAG: ABC transporter permease [Propioniciclava sp.]
MKPLDLIRTAVGDTLRSKARTTLTVIAIFLGAFTLTLTSGVGTGINSFIDDTVASIGTADTMTVTKPTDSSVNPLDDLPQEYDPDARTTDRGPDSGTILLMDADDLDVIAEVEGVEEVTPIKAVSLDYIRYDGGTRYTAAVSSYREGQNLELAAGDVPDNESSDAQVVIPDNYLESLDLDTAGDAVGETLRLVLTDGNDERQWAEAEIVAVAEEALAGPSGSNLMMNTALNDTLYDLQSQGVAKADRDKWEQAGLTMESGLTTEEVAALQDELLDEGDSAETVADQLGAFTTVIDTIVLVLNGFAVIALIAAGFGIVNTLLMSVQERTREIGLNKALGMGSGSIFALFSAEAITIGLLGSLIGVVGAMIAGTVVSNALTTSFLEGLPGLQLIAFTPASILSIVLLITGLAFVAGVLPAARAAGKDPVEALRFE